MFCFTTFIRNGVAATVFTVTTGFSTTALAQTADVPVAPTSPTPAFHNAIRLDLGGLVISNLANTMLGNSEQLLPLLLSYERQVGKRSSLVAEGLLNGGTSWENKAGVSLQNRYYLLPMRPKTALQGLYVAPVVGYRSIKLSYNYQVATHRSLLGAGVLVGWQGNFPHCQRVFFDASMGVMAWGKPGADRVEGSAIPSYYYHEQTYYERNSAVADGRLGIGFRF